MRFNKKGLFTVEAFVSLSITLLLVGLITSIVQVSHAQYTVFERKIREMEEYFSHKDVSIIVKAVLILIHMILMVEKTVIWMN